MDTELHPQEQHTVEQTGIQQQDPLPQTLNLAECIESLDEYGGMRLVKSLVRDAENMDPRRKALHDIFLSDPLYKEARKRLAKTLDLWIDVLDNEKTDPDELSAYCLKECQRVERSISDNMFTLRGEIRELEKTYRVLDTFFVNTQQEEIHFLNLMNVNKKDLLMMDTKSSKALIKEVDDKYDSLDLKDSYSLMLIPGFLKSAQQIQDWAAIAHRNKVLLITDFEDDLTYQELLLRLEKSNLQRPHRDNSSVVVVCNYILSRRKSELSEEDEDLYIPASGALVGRMTDVDNVSIAQGIAGRKFGSLDHALSVRFNLLKAELSKLIDLGVVPLVEVDGQVLAFSNRTPYDGPMMELQEYPIVRVFNWVSKVIQQFCNDKAFVNWNSAIRNEMVENLQAFLGKYKGAGKLYENYTIKGVNRDSDTGNILVQVEIKPFFAAKNFLIELTGKTDKGKMTATWEDNLQ